MFNRRKFIVGAACASALAAIGFTSIKADSAIEELPPVVLNQEDLDSIQGFFDYFGVESTSLFKSAMKECRNEITPISQYRLKTGLCETLVTSTHPLIKEKFFTNIVENCRTFLLSVKYI